MAVNQWINDLAKEATARPINWDHVRGLATDLSLEAKTKAQTDAATHAKRACDHMSLNMAVGELRRAFLGPTLGPVSDIFRPR